MEFRVDVDANWVVRVTNLQTQKPVVDSTGKAFARALGKVGEGLKCFPQPPDEEAKKIAAGSPHYELCTTKDEQVIGGIYQGLLRREATDVEKFGRYLFATLLGEELWQAIKNEEKTQPIELALNWKDDYLFNRLPWEMMHSQERFLAAEPEVAITRRVAGTTQTLSKIAAPRVLFVVGSDLAKDSRIKPGAEYLGLLRSLKPSAKLRLKTHLLLEASPRRLKAAIMWFKPTVVHFICHGFPNMEETRLQLMADEGGGVDSVTAEMLLKMLRPDPAMALPQIVILNACHTATEYQPEMLMKSGQVSSPIAVKLVAGDGESPGVPIVVGMAGEVADQACRLFTRCFYEALLEGGEIAQAASAGRRLGIIDLGQTDPTTSIDWALPTLFMSAAVTEPKLQIIATPNEEAWHEAAAQFAPPDYPAFCDRLSFFEWYDCLMARDHKALPPPQQHSGDLQLLAVALDPKEKKGKKEAQLGLTSLLKQFAANAVLDGHLPVLFELKWLQRTEYPKDLAGLMSGFRKAMMNTANEFVLDFNPDSIDLLADVAYSAAPPPPDNLPKEVQDAYRAERNWKDPQVWFAALRIDLLRLLELGRKKLEPPKPENGELAAPTNERALPKLLLLVDDVHQMGAGPLLVQFFSSDQGLRSQRPLSDGGPSARADIRVVCTYTTSADLEPTIKDLREANGARELPLQAFQQPEDRLAYEFFLSRWKDAHEKEIPLAVDRKANPVLVEFFFDSLKESVDGIPSNLKSAAANIVISLNYKMPVPPGPILRPMNDEDLIKLIPEMKRTRGL